ncbi:hypothetical protein [Tropicimonas sediminicola]|uniref:EpsG family protein n=1 Tax=Tropicimonas sediminicola TaxID=1031541 RepID=A0A239J5N7_9RHOB|nr:hypothetical protein [Tropicimonas sediminicola]SNT01125.1 hypothetical protein SAMN05421757_105114 [Tropicimonas sediminicola]
MTIISAANGQTSDRWLRGAVVGLLAISLILSLRNLWIDYRAGGDPFRQGDWLINSAAGFVRRSLPGDLVLALSDRTGWSPLTLLTAFQAALLVVLYSQIARLLSEIPARVAFLFAFCPGFVLVFWAADPMGTVRKEMLVFLALCLCALGVIRDSRARLLAGSLVFVAGVLAHEAMILFAPALAAIYYLGWKRSPGRPADALLAVGTFGAAAAIFLIALKHGQVPEPELVCQALIDRGMSDQVCAGAIKWLGVDSAVALNAVQTVLSFDRAATGFSMGLFLALCPLFYLASRTDRPGAAAIAIVLLALPFLPLFLVAIDWGRWVSFHVFTVVVLGSLAFRLKLVSLQKDLGLLPLVIFAVTALCFSPLTMVGLNYGGLVRRLVLDVSSLLP